MRIFICTSLCYPYGSAASGRLHAIAKSCKENGIDPIIISSGKNIENEYIYEKNLYTHCDIDYYNITTKQDMKSLYKNKGVFIEIIKQMRISNNDIVVVYSNLNYFCNTIYNFCKKNVGCKIYFDITEWHLPSQYSTYCLTPYYISFFLNALFVMPKSDGIVCISDYLSKKSVWKNNKKFVLPTIIDVDSYQYKNNRDYVICNFIYPGNPGKKDDFISMLKGFSLLPDENKKKTRFHITSVKKETLTALLGKKAYLLDELKDIIVYHDWLEYNELLELYSKAHFLLISKPDNIVSQANFPSKVPELMACGVVPVITKVGDITKYATDGVDSMLIDKNDPRDIADSILKAISLSQNQFETMSKNARKTAEEKFDYKNWADKLVNFVLND